MWYYIYEMENNKTLFVGMTFEFGSYPQNAVKDAEVVAFAKVLFKKSDGKKPPMLEYNNSEGKGFLCDFVFDGKRYRLVHTVKYNCGDSFFKTNGYKKGETYVFEYAPIAWRVLGIDGDLALCASERCLDVCDYCNKAINRKRFFCGCDEVSHINNYKNSNVRAFLNGAFFETAFSAKEKARIELTEIDNGDHTTKKQPNVYVCENTQDRVFLLSYAQASTLFADNAARCKKATEYAKAQGCYAYATKDRKYNNSDWWLRSPDAKYENCVRCVGDGGGIGDGGFSCSNEPADAAEAVVPSVMLKCNR